MLKKFIFLISSPLLFFHCVQEKPDIRVGCEATANEKYLIKWETFPPLKGTVKIYESFKPDSFNLYSPIAEEEINKGFKAVSVLRTLNRSYFHLVFNKKYSVTTAERVVPMQNLYNFRDIGGYYNSSNRQTQWGKLYRSSSLSQATRQDMIVLCNLGIKTIIDFRTEREKFNNPDKYTAPQVFNLPLNWNPPTVFFDKILSKEMKTGDVKIKMQDAMAALLEDNTDYYVKLFDILLNEKNYPVVVNCTTGKDRSGIATALILSALEVEWEQIVNDYLLSDDLIDFNSMLQNAEMYDSEIQETMTAMFRSHRETITYAFEIINKKYGSVDKYLEQELNLTPKKREKLKEILLYQSIN
jgi:protein-tyrosine phosphatase